MIELKNITKRYGKNENEVFALKDVSLRIDQGEFVAIMGASGSGKSTLLHIIGAMDRATEGEYLLDGVNVSSYSEKQLCRIRKEKVTFVFQNFALMDKYSAYENIELPLLHTKKSRAERKKLIREAAGKLKVEDQLNKKPKQMSGGQQQRIALARALVSLSLIHIYWCMILHKCVIQISKQTLPVNRFGKIAEHMLSLIHI